MQNSQRVHYALATVFWGKQIATALAVLSCALVLTACGDDSSTTASNQTPAGPTGPTISAADKKAAAAAVKAEKKNQKSAKESDGIDVPDSKDLGNSLGTDPSSRKVQPTPKSVKDLSSSTKRAVTAAFTSMINAFDAKNVSYLCNGAYAKDFMKFTETKGGCVKYTNSVLEPVKSYSAKGVTVAPVAGSSLLQVSATLTPVTVKGKQSVDASFYFKEENGHWKRAVPLGIQN
jgi:hypothetical protein